MRFMVRWLEKSGQRGRNLLVSRLGLPVPVGGGVEAVPFLPEAEWIRTAGSIHREHAIQVVDFVLEQFGPVAGELDLVRSALEVLVADPNVMGPLDPDQEIGKREAVVPDREILGADVHDFRIDEGPAGPSHSDRSEGDGPAAPGPGDWEPRGSRPSPWNPRCRCPRFPD